MSDGNHEVRTAWGFLAVRTNGLERYPGESDQWWADRVTILMAEAIREIVGLYKDGILEKPESYAYAYPDLLTFHDSPTTIENRLFTMHLKHRMRAFQGAFHMNPDYTLWYGWNEMVQDLNEIRAMATEMREKHKAK